MDVRFAAGAKDEIDSAIETGKLVPGTIVFTDTNEISRVNADGTAGLIEAKTQSEIEVMGVTVGNLTDGKKIPPNITMDDFIKMVVQKEINPTYTQPVISVVNATGTSAGAYEVGTSISPKVKATFTKNDAGALTNIKVMKGAESIGDGGVTTPFTCNGDDFILGEADVSITSVVAYAEGPVQNTNFGNPYPTGHIVAGSKTSSPYTFSAKRNLFYGTLDSAADTMDSASVRSLPQKKMAPANGTAFTINVPVGAQSVVVAYPAAVSNELSKALYVEQSNTDISNSFRAGKQTVQVAGANGTDFKTNYKVYIYSMAIPAAAEMTINITIC